MQIQLSTRDFSIRCSWPRITRRCQSRHGPASAVGWWVAIFPAMSIINACGLFWFKILKHIRYIRDPRLFGALTMRSPVVKAIRLEESDSDCDLPLVKQIRKPWGQGKAALQKQKRARLAHLITGFLMSRLDAEEIQRTGQIFPRGTLKKRVLRKVFSWTPCIKGRVFTKPLLKLVVRKIIREVGIVPMDPKKTFGSFVNQQARRFGMLARQAKRIKSFEDFGVESVGCMICWNRILLISIY